MITTAGFSRDIIYVIIPTVDVTLAMINCVRASVSIVDQNDLRKSLDGTKTILKFIPTASTPFLAETWLSLGEILLIIAGAEWYDAETI